MPVFREGCVSSLILNQIGNKRTCNKTLRKILLEKRLDGPLYILMLSSYYVPGTASGPKSTVVSRHSYIVSAQLYTFIVHTCAKRIVQLKDIMQDINTLTGALLTRVPYTQILREEYTSSYFCRMQIRVQYPSELQTPHVLNWINYHHICCFFIYIYLFISIIINCIHEIAQVLNYTAPSISLFLLTYSNQLMM